MHRSIFASLAALTPSATRNATGMASSRAPSSASMASASEANASGSTLSTSAARWRDDDDAIERIWNGFGSSSGDPSGDPNHAHDAAKAPSSRLSATSDLLVDVTAALAPAAAASGVNAIPLAAAATASAAATIGNGPRPVIRPRRSANASRRLASSTTGASLAPLSTGLSPFARARPIFASADLAADADARLASSPPPLASSSSPPPIASRSCGMAAAARATNVAGSSGGTLSSCRNFSLLYTRPSAKTSSWHASATSRTVMGSAFCLLAAYTHAPVSIVVHSPSPHRPSHAFTTSALASAAASFPSLSWPHAKLTDLVMFSMCVASSSLKNCLAMCAPAPPGPIASPPRAAASCPPRSSWT